MAEKATLVVKVMDVDEGFFIEDCSVHVETTEGETLEGMLADGRYTVEAEVGQTLNITVTAEGYNPWDMQGYYVSGDDDDIRAELGRAKPGPTPGSKYVTEMGDLFPHKLSSELIVKY